MEKLQFWMVKSSFLVRIVGLGFTFMSPYSDRINLKEDPYLSKLTFDRAS